MNKTVGQELLTPQDKKVHLSQKDLARLRHIRLYFIPAEYKHRSDPTYMKPGDIFKLVVTCPKSLFWKINSTDLQVVFGDQEQTFIKRGAIGQFISAPIKINDSNPANGPVDISIFYGNYFLTSQNSLLLIDRQAPHSPGKPEIIKIGPDHLLLKWGRDKKNKDVMEYLVEKLGPKDWEEVTRVSVITLECKIKAESVGLYRVTSLDWAGNKSQSEEFKVNKSGCTDLEFEFVVHTQNEIDALILSKMEACNKLSVILNDSSHRYHAIVIKDKKVKMINMGYTPPPKYFKQEAIFDKEKMGFNVTVIYKSCP